MEKKESKCNYKNIKLKHDTPINNLYAILDRKEDNLFLNKDNDLALAIVKARIIQNGLKSEKTYGKQ